MHEQGSTHLPRLPGPAAVGVTAVARGGRRLPKGAADRFSRSTATGGCGCDPTEGAVVLFYAYAPLSDPRGVVARLQAVCEAQGVTGKLRVAAEVRGGRILFPKCVFFPTLKFF